MNYFLMLIILVMGGAFFFLHQQDQQQIAALQGQIDFSPVAGRGNSPVTSGGFANTPATRGNETLPTDEAMPTFSHAEGIQPGHATPAAPVVAVLPPDESRSSAIDSATSAASAAQDADSLGTITTLDGHSYQDCRVLRIESDGVTFRDSDGITKILFPLMPPDMQKKFGYDPKAAVAQTEAEIKYQQEAQQAGATTNAATSTTPQ